MKNYGFRLPEELMGEIETIASNEGRDKSSLVREILSEGVKARGGKAVFSLESRVKQLEERVGMLESY
ncbi:MAG: hypothetical protein AAFX80_14865 [Cyanobacteria bacterium J06639_18]